MNIYFLSFKKCLQGLIKKYREWIHISDILQYAGDGCDVMNMPT